MIVGSQAVVRNDSYSVPYAYFTPMVKTCKIVVQYHKQDIEIDIDVVKLQNDFKTIGIISVAFL